MEFQVQGAKLERVLPKNQHTKRIFLNIENWCIGEVSKQIGLHSQFSISKIFEIFLNFWEFAVTPILEIQ